MNITILANRDLHANIALNLLLPLFKLHRITLFLSESVGLPKPGWQTPQPLQQLKLIEQGLFNQVITPLLEQQGCRARYLSFNELGELSGNGCRGLENINSPAGFDVFQASQPDLVLCIRFGKVIKAPAIAIPRLGVLNLHSGLLPQYQGILTTLHALLAGESEVGCTLHYIDSAEIDTGNIIETASVKVDKSLSLFGHVLQLYPLGCTMIMDAIARLVEGEVLTGKAQDVTQQHYFGLPDTEHFNALEKSGFALWHQNEVLDVLHRYLPEALSASVGSMVTP